MGRGMYELIRTLEEGFAAGWYEWLMLIVPTVIAMLNVWIVNRNTDKQISAQNKETYRPRLCVEKIDEVKHEIDKRYLYACSNEYREGNNNVTLYVDIELSNIGNGLANDLEFYMLNNGKKCIGMQAEYEDKNQELNSTIEIPKDKSKIVKFLLEFNIDNKEN